MSDSRNNKVQKNFKIPIDFKVLFDDFCHDHRYVASDVATAGMAFLMCLSHEQRILLFELFDEFANNDYDIDKVLSEMNIVFDISRNSDSD